MEEEELAVEGVMSMNELHVQLVGPNAFLGAVVGIQGFGVIFDSLGFVFRRGPADNQGNFLSLDVPAFVELGAFFLKTGFVLDRLAADGADRTEIQVAFAADNDFIAYGEGNFGVADAFVADTGGDVNFIELLHDGAAFVINRYVLSTTYF